MLWKFEIMGLREGRGWIHCFTSNEPTRERAVRDFQVNILPDLGSREWRVTEVES